MFSPTLIPAHTLVTGRIDTPADLIVEGRCDGEIFVGGVLTVARGASCAAQVRAREAYIHGAVTGPVVCSERIVVAAGARVVGDLRAPEIAVDERGVVDGVVEILASPTAAAPNSRAVFARQPRPTRPEPAASRTGAASAEPVADAASARAPRGSRARIPTLPRPRGRTAVARRDTPEHRSES